MKVLRFRVNDEGFTVTGQGLGFRFGLGVRV
jgi:hypothetical protein